ncbi:hypothetical protein TNCV_1590721 [Trichonephila clavipes]|nr:hypothetical protein TNCV_1590721 [Trichonephila clavipes]
MTVVARGRSVMSSSLVPLKTLRVERLMYFKSVEAENPPIGVMLKLGEGVPAELSCSSLDQGSKLGDSLRGRGSQVVKVSDHGWRVMSSSPVPLKTSRVGERCTLNLSRAQASSRWCGS